jgi:hypothetical protein
MEENNQLTFSCLGQITFTKKCNLSADTLCQHILVRNSIHELHGGRGVWGKKDLSVAPDFGIKTFQCHAKHKRNCEEENKNYSSHWTLKVCGILVLLSFISQMHDVWFLFLNVWNYVLCWTHVFTTLDFSFTCKKFNSCFMKCFLVRKTPAATVS